MPRPLVQRWSGVPRLAPRCSHSARRWQLPRPLRPVPGGLRARFAAPPPRCHGHRAAVGCRRRGPAPGPGWDAGSDRSARDREAEATWHGRAAVGLWGRAVCRLHEEGRGGGTLRAGSRPPLPACRGGFVCVGALAAPSADMLRAVPVPALASGLLLPVSEGFRKAGPLRKAAWAKPGRCCGHGSGGTGTGGSVVTGVRGSGPPGARRSRALAAPDSVPPHPTAPGLELGAAPRRALPAACSARVSSLITFAFAAFHLVTKVKPARGVCLCSVLPRVVFAPGGVCGYGR